MTNSVPEPLVSIVIPAINEESRLPNTLHLCIDFLKQLSFGSEIVVVTDGSGDKTVQVAELFISLFPNLRVISYPVNRGKGFAVKMGMLEARGQYRLFMDADHAVPIGTLSKFLEVAQSGYDIVIGSRSHEDSKLIKQQKFFRRNLALLFRQLQKIVLRLPYEDTQCGYKLFSAAAAESLFNRMTFDCAYFDAEILYIAHKLNMTIYQHPVVWTHHPESRLPIGVKRSLQLIRLMFKIPTIHG